MSSFSSSPPRAAPATTDDTTDAEKVTECLLGKVALVTGGSRGVGRGIAESLARAGADIIVNDLEPVDEEEEGLKLDTQRSIREIGRRCITCFGDVSDEGDVKRIFEIAVSKFGHIDIVVANAASSIRSGILGGTFEGARRTIEVCQFGAIHTAKYAANHMTGSTFESGDRRRIIFISSIMGRDVIMDTAYAYGMSKAAIMHLGRVLASELAPHGVNVNVITPGWIDTPGERAWSTDAAIAAGAACIPLGRLGKPRDIGDMVAFLAGPGGDYITGSVIDIVGGYRSGLRLPGLEKHTE